jgi:predicted negative regulator of RcsB-dependent stress response
MCKDFHDHHNHNHHRLRRHYRHNIIIIIIVVVIIIIQLFVQEFTLNTRQNMVEESRQYLDIEVN